MPQPIRLSDPHAVLSGHAVLPGHHDLTGTPLVVVSSPRSEILAGDLVFITAKIVVAPVRRTHVVGVPNEFLFRRLLPGESFVVTVPPAEVVVTERTGLGVTTRLAARNEVAACPRCYDFVVVTGTPYCWPADLPALVGPDDLLMPVGYTSYDRVRNCRVRALYPGETVTVTPAGTSAG
jgi:hypothetical protein